MTVTGAQAVAGVDFDVDLFRAYLARERPDLTGRLNVERVGGGQSNPTYFIALGTEEFVLRKQPAGTLLPGAHNVIREHRLMNALAGTSVPVPGMILACPDPDVIGTQFFLMSRLHGRIFHDMDLSEAPIAQRRELYLAQARALAALHDVDYADAGLGDLGRPGSFAARQIDRWAAGWGDERLVDIQRIRGWLHGHRPDSERQALVHGDFKFGNLVFAPDDPQLIGVLDWELAAIGEPMVDLGHIWSATWATRPEEYGGVLDVDLEAAGLPSDDEFLEEYYAASGSTDRLLPFHRVLGLFRNAGIFHGIGKRAEAGNATAANAAHQGTIGHTYLDRALEIIESSR